MNRSSGGIWFKVPDVKGTSNLERSGGFVSPGSCDGSADRFFQEESRTEFSPQPLGTEENITKIIMAGNPDGGKAAAVATAAQVEVVLVVVQPQQLKRAGNVR